MFIIPKQELDEIVNDNFGSGDAQTSPLMMWQNCKSSHRQMM